jgi:hypothetical protein
MQPAPNSIHFGFETIGFIDFEKGGYQKFPMWYLSSRFTYLARLLLNNIMKSSSQPNPSGVTLRAFVISLILIPPNCYWVVQSEAVWGTTYLTIVSLFFNVTFDLLVLVWLNAFFKRLAPKAALKQGELLTIYVMLCLGSSVAGNNFLENLVLSIGHAFWFATPENEWADLFFRFVPDWLAVKDRSVLRGFYEGESSIYRAEYINAWLKPLAFWACFSFVLIFTFLCINVFIRKQWTEREKLSYPIIQVPLELTRNGTGGHLFSNKLFLLAFGISATITLLNGLHFHYPVVPNIRLHTNIGYLFTEKPFNAIGWMPVVIYPWIVGLVFFIPLDLSFSCWFFYLFAKSQNVLSSIVGWRSLPSFPYFEQQTTGGWLGLLVIAIWLTRRHLSDVLRQVFRFRRNNPLNSFPLNNPLAPFIKGEGGQGDCGKREADDSNEPMSYRIALLGFILGLCFLIAFCMAGGMSFWVALAFFVFLIGLEVTITRMRAELGPPMHELGWVGPDTIIATALGSRRLGGGNLTMLTYLYFTDRTVSSHPMPHQLEGFKIAERVGINPKKLPAAMVIAVLLGIISSLWALLHSAYKTGVAAGFTGYVGIPWESFNRLAWWIHYPIGTDYPALGFIGIGFVFSLVMMLLRLRFLWWPLHPVGYAISTSGWVINYIWFSFLFSWLIKWILLKHGSIKAYRNATPFFLGLILGEYAIGGFWNILGIALGIRTYGFFES